MIGSANGQPQGETFVRPLWHHAVPAPEHSGPLVILDRGENIYLWDVEGKRYIDGLSTHGACLVGHGRTELADAAQAQMERGAHLAPVFGCTNEPARALARRLLELTGRPGGSVWFATSGSEANEAAIRIALSFHLNRGQPHRRIILSADDCYHGNTMATAAASGRPEYRHFTYELEPMFVRVPATPHADQAASTRFVDALKETIEQLGAHRIAAFIAEPIPASKGIRVPPAGHWHAVRQVLNDHGILYITDEVLNGFGRTGAMFAQQHYGVVGDLITLSKGLSSGYFPMSACVAADFVAAEFAEYGDRALQHMGTYSGHATGCAVAMRALDIVERENLVANARTQGKRIEAALGEVATRHAGRVHPPAGAGLFWSMTFEPDRERLLGREVLAHCRTRGMLIMAHGNVAFLDPPLVSTSEQVDQMVSIFADSVAATLAQVLSVPGAQASPPAGWRD